MTAAQHITETTQELGEIVKQLRNEPDPYLQAAGHLIRAVLWLGAVVDRASQRPTVGMGNG